MKDGSIRKTKIGRRRGTTALGDTRTPQRPVTAAVDGDTACKTDTMAAPTSTTDGGYNMTDGTLVSPTDGSVTVVRRAVIAQLDGELTARDGGRAGRYVSTVRPAMVVLRYVCETDEVGSTTAECTTARTTTAVTSTSVPLTTAPGHSNEVSTSEEGATKYNKSSATGDAMTTPELGVEITN
ncbi:Gag-pol fusion protein [Phytophthora cinnamomi]|uniref:Gag-pol fusion protein n=1 Tax=Phytophthora cinnamomi TaxID=4785 RepID=UPI003559B98A|nr:Gag-pol fusion protein [Phytophthora cinnamomi]